MTLEQLVLFVLVALVWLGGALLRWLKARAERAEPPAAPEERPRREPPGLRYRVEGVAVPPPSLPPPASAPAPLLPHPRRRRRVIVGDAGDLRRAIVLMTVLGPCRALERETVERRR